MASPTYQTSDSEPPPRRIRVLPSQLANLIAAGEVVERPSAVLKELLENALDAGARRVSVELVAGGRRLVQVSDDGHGMNPDDAVLCFERHATSKIAAPGDLNAIHTYGFRGEALPSIAAVSRTTLQTCADDSGLGTEVIIEGGQLRAVKEVGRTRGTTVTVRDLFFNTPARRKFLRTDATELRHILREMTGLALTKPDLGFTLSHGGRVLLECNPVSTWQERVRTVFGREMLLRSIPVDKTDGTGRLYGLLGRPGDSGGGFTEQFLLVNGRSVQSRVFRKAVLDGFEATTESGRQPFFVLFLELDPATVDVNVHPQKREVRFRDDRAVYDLIFSAVRSAFSDTASRERGASPETLLVPVPAEEDTRPFTEDDRTREEAPSAEPAPSGIPSFWNAPPDRPYVPATAKGADRFHRLSDGEATYLPGTGSARATFSALPDIKPSPKARAEDAKAAQVALDLVSKGPGSFSASEGLGAIAASELEKTVWQFQRKYIFVNTRDGLWIIDQHVAHERILYEEAMAGFAGDVPASQQLLFPTVIELTPEQDTVFDEVEEIFRSLGFGIRRLSDRKIEADAYPGALHNWEDGNVIRRMIDEMRELGFKRTGLKEQIAIAYSCHAAVKSGEHLPPATMRWLIERLFATSMPPVCPHGRPIIVKIETAELDQRFGRV